ncbi:E2 ubiquitin-protein ligase peroxin 4 [Polyrhizophydium stewartii]|uniref:E2 ubiquitin-protein ligase peroxin 4 n=1 Tax=Polyrhizophydium stewartii TaxID=2732419 RepID=A0ABR4N0F7_9FUNG|nr:E2 ubiquitin-protein ligase peroxin 4 [Polyrhizophydium stewartii]
MSAARRLLKELGEARRAAASQPGGGSGGADSGPDAAGKSQAPAQPLVHLEPAGEEDLFHWRAVIAGASGSPYAGGRFELAIEVPRDYPIAPPAMRFVTKVCHPNVHLKTGEICLDLLKSAWSPAWTLQSACLAVAVLLTSPEPDSPLNCDAANLLRAGDLRGYNSLVSMYTSLYATP